VLAPHGSLYFHIDYREVHYCKIWLDRIFGRDCFLNEIIWAYKTRLRRDNKRQDPRKIYLSMCFFGQASKAEHKLSRKRFWPTAKLLVESTATSSGCPSATSRTSRLRLCRS
jgi:hypothetical protein